MLKVEASVQIDQPVEKVFSYMTEPDNLTNWMSELQEAKQITEGPVGVGTKISAVANVLGRQVENVQDVIDYETNKKFSIKSTSGPTKNEDEFTFEQVDGGTKITRKTEGEIAGFFRMAEPLVGRMLRRQFETNFANLKDLLEASA